MELSNKQQHNRNRHNFLLTLFPNQKKEYTTIEMNGFHLVRQWNGGNNQWQVAIYTKNSWKKAQDYLKVTARQTSDSGQTAIFEADREAQRPNKPTGSSPR